MTQPNTLHPTAPWLLAVKQSSFGVEGANYVPLDETKLDNKIGFVLYASAQYTIHTIISQYFFLNISDIFECDIYVRPIAPSPLLSTNR